MKLLAWNVFILFILIVNLNWTVDTLLLEPQDEEHERSDEAFVSSEYSVKFASHLSKDQIQEIAKRAGFTRIIEVPGLGKNFYRLSLDESEHKDAPSESTDDETVSSAGKSKRDHIEIKRALSQDNHVKWLRREVYLEREKRQPPLRTGSNRRERRSSITKDPEADKEYYISNTGQTSGPKGFDSCIKPAWDEGLTGKGIRTTILDDGMDYTHEDLKNQYDANSSTDLNGNDNDPFPNDKDPYNAHGTKCAGTIAAEKDNGVCGVGIAPGSKVGSIRMLDGKATDSLEANALSFHRDYIHQYSCSWGPKDNGKTFGRPGKLGRIALEQGAKLGRGGLGSLFVWATGNGGIMQDDCNADGYVNSIYTIGIGSVNEYGVSTYYGEECSPTMAVTFCSGKHSAYDYGTQAHVVTTYLHHQCTDNFVGTSSAAPLAAGIFALVLEANPWLTWRDMQHLIVHTAHKTSPLDEGWKKNGAGFNFNHKFGFGVLQACKMVDLAKKWKKVGTHRSCHFKLNFQNGEIPSGHHFKLNFTTDGCQKCQKKRQDANGRCSSAVHHLEHVQVKVTLKHRCRGHLTIKLVSPHGTVSKLLHLRPNDNSPNGLKGWTFMTVFKWGEDPAGTWQLIFDDNMGREMQNKDPNKRDMEEVYIQLMNYKRSSTSLNMREITEGLSAMQKEQVDAVFRRNTQDTAQVEEAEKLSEADEETHSDQETRSRRNVNSDDHEYLEKFVKDYLESKKISADEEYGPESRSQAKRAEQRIHEEENYMEQQDTEGRETIEKRGIFNNEHKCNTEMNNPSLASSDIAGKVMEIAVTLYGTRDDSKSSSA